MKTITKPGRNGQPLKCWAMSARAFQQMHDDSMGLCCACGAERDSCEPDARKYPCEVCGEARVYGCEELLMLGRIVITGGRKAATE